MLSFIWECLPWLSSRRLSCPERLRKQPGEICQRSESHSACASCPEGDEHVETILRPVRASTQKGSHEPHLRGPEESRGGESANWVGRDASRLRCHASGSER